ncbi:MAG: hypothetical protein ACP5O1_08780 [Phycisphaerae bacterium]
MGIIDIMDEELLKRMASKYVWWKTPEEALAFPHRIIAQVMNIGDFDDVQELADIAGDEGLREVLKSAEPGEFNLRSWHYWHYRLGLAELGAVPPLPQRRLA